MIYGSVIIIDSQAHLDSDFMYTVKIAQKTVSGLKEMRPLLEKYDSFILTSKLIWFQFSYRQHQIKQRVTGESTIMLRESCQGESSVMRLRLEGCKKPITNTH